MKGAILKMKQKYSTAVAKRKKKAADRKEGDGGRDKQSQRQKKKEEQQPRSSSSKRGVPQSKSLEEQQQQQQQQSTRRQSASPVKSRLPPARCKEDDNDDDDDATDVLSMDSRQLQQQQPPSPRRPRYPSNMSSRSFESYDSSHVSFASPISTSKQIPSNRPRNSHSKHPLQQQLQQQQQHTRGRSPSIRPGVVAGEEIYEDDRDDDESFVEDEEDESYFSSSSYSNSSFYSDDEEDEDEDASWDSGSENSEEDVEDEDDQDELESRRSFVSFEEDDLHPPSEDEQDKEYAENKLRDIGTVVRASDRHDDDDDDDGENENGLATDMSYDTKDDKSLDTTEEREFQEFMKQEQKKKEAKNNGGGGGFFWMLGFGQSVDEDAEDAEESSTTLEDSNNTELNAEEDTDTVGETVLSEPEEDDGETTLAEESVMTPTFPHRQPKEDSQRSESSLIKTKSVETTQVAKAGCFINFMASADSIDGSYGGLRDGDILIAESSMESSHARASFDEREEEEEEEEDDETAYTLGEDTRMDMASQTERTAGDAVAQKNEMQERAKSAAVPPASMYDRPLSPPMSFFSWFSQDETPDNSNVQQQQQVRRELYGDEEASSGLGSASIEETIVVHTIVDSSHTRDDKEKEDSLHKALMSDDDDEDDDNDNDDEITCGDSTINTSPPKEEGNSSSHKSPKFSKGKSCSENADTKPASSFAGSTTSRSNGTPGHPSIDRSLEIRPSLGSFAAALAPVVPMDEEDDARYTEDGTKLVVSFHRRGNILPDSESEPEESQNETAESGSDVSYKEEFELELGSYEINEAEESGDSSSCNDSTSDDGGPRRKRAEMLDNYDISEIVHGRRRFMPKPKAGTLDTAFHDSRFEKDGPPAGLHPLNVDAAGFRRERRRSALKAHRDFLHKSQNARSQQEEHIDSIAKAVEDIVSNRVVPSDDSHSKEPSWDGSNALQKVQPSGEWIEEAWQSLGTEELIPNSSNSAKNLSQTSASSNSIVENNRTTKADVQKADALVDLVRTALHGILSQDEQADDGSAQKEGDTTTNSQSAGEQQVAFVPDVFQAAYDFFGMSKQEPAAALSDMESTTKHDSLKCTGFNPNPKKCTTDMIGETAMPIAASSHEKSVGRLEELQQEEEVASDSALSSIVEVQEESSASKQVEDSPTESSPDITSHSDEAVLEQQPSSKESETDEKREADLKDRFNVDGIPLELRPRKIWKAFDSFSVAPSTAENASTVDSAAGETQDGLVGASVSSHKVAEKKQATPSKRMEKEIASTSSCDDKSGTDSGSSAKKEEMPVQPNYQKHAAEDALRFKSRRLQHISRIASKRLEAQQKGGERRDEPTKIAKNIEKPPARPTESSSYVPYSSEATAYRQHVNNIRSRLRQRRRSKIFHGDEEGTTKTETKSVELEAVTEQRDDSSSGTDEFFDANSSVADDKQSDSDASPKMVKEEVNDPVTKQEGHEGKKPSVPKETSMASPPPPPSAPTVLYEFLSPAVDSKMKTKTKISIKSTAFNADEDDETNLSTRSWGSMYSAFSLD